MFKGFIKNFILVFLLAFALTALYDKVKMVFDVSVSGWNIHWIIMWRTIGSMFSGYPLVMATLIFVVVFALYLIWRDRESGKENKEVLQKLDKIIELLGRKNGESGTGNNK